MDKNRPYFNIDYDMAIMLGNKFDGVVLKVKKSTDIITFPVVDEDQFIQPFDFDIDFNNRQIYGKLDYKRVGETHIFYCP
jgi:hypothetical protein